MSYTELLEALRKIPEEILLDLLGVTSEDLVDAFQEIILENEDKYRKYLDL